MRFFSSNIRWALTVWSDQAEARGSFVMELSRRGLASFWNTLSSLRVYVPQPGCHPTYTKSEYTNLSNTCPDFPGQFLLSVGHSSIPLKLWQYSRDSTWHLPMALSPGRASVLLDVMDSPSLGNCRQHSGCMTARDHSTTPSFSLRFSLPTLHPQHTKMTVLFVLTEGSFQASLLTLWMGINRLDLYEWDHTTYIDLQPASFVTLIKVKKCPGEKKNVFLTVPQYSTYSCSKMYLSPKLQWKALHRHLCTYTELSC